MEKNFDSKSFSSCDISMVFDGPNDVNISHSNQCNDVYSAGVKPKQRPKKKKKKKKKKVKFNLPLLGKGVNYYMWKNDEAENHYG